MAVKEVENSFLLLFGTETGQAKAIAEIIRDKALERGLHPQLHCFSHYDSEFFLTKTRVLVTVVSTTGDGEPPYNIRKAWRKLRGKSLTSDYLSGLNFALLGLGDTNYDNFCNMGKMLNKRLLELGASPFYPPGFADDAVGLEGVVEPWIDGLWGALDKILHSSPQRETTPPKKETTGPLPTSASLENTLEQLTITNGPVVKETSIDQSDSANSEPLKPLSSGSLYDDLRRTSVDMGTELTLPSAPPPYLTLSLHPPQPHSGADSGHFPFHKVSYRLGSTISMATIVKARPLTNEGSVKRTLEMTLKVKEDVVYEPGDAVGVVCPNDSEEVEWVLHRLHLSTQSAHTLTLSLHTATAKKKPTLPPHIPTPCTVRDLFTHCLDIRAVPKKAFLRLLATHCSDGGEQRRLEELSSRQGAAQYTRFVTELRTDLLDILNTFPSCAPPLEALIENMPRLQPRYYSVTSSPLADPHILAVAFNVETLPAREWAGQTMRRRGLATGWLAHVADTRLPATPTQVPVFTRSHNPFRLPSVSDRPIIMIGPGTGVAPFLGFLQHMAQQEVGGTKCRKAWLFFGCRHPEFDHLYKDELERFHSTGLLTRLTVVFSRYPNERGGARYVQESVCEEWREVGRWVLEDQATVYLCGDAQTMLKQTEKALNESLSKYISQSSSSGAESATSDPVSVLKEEGRLLVDLWT